MGEKRNEIRDCRFERDTGFGNFTKRDSGNVDLWNHYQFEAIHVVDKDLVYGACVKGKSIFTIILRRDGYGIRGEASLLTKYEADWEHVGSMAILRRCLYTSHYK